MSTKLRDLTEVCQRCQKPRGAHKADRLSCPVGKKHRELYTLESRVMRSDHCTDDISSDKQDGESDEYDIIYYGWHPYMETENEIEWIDNTNKISDSTKFLLPPEA